MLYWFIKDYAHIEGIKIVGINTYMEHQDIRDRIYKNSDIVLIPELKPFEIKEKYGIPCFTKQQDEYVKRYQNGSRSKCTMDFVLGNNPIYRLNKKARELLLNDKLHKISPDCCKHLKKKTAYKFEKDNNLKPILRS